MIQSFFQSVGNVLVPGTLQPLPASLTQAIQHFAKQLLVWLQMALQHLPNQLRKRKMQGQSVSQSRNQGTKNLVEKGRTADPNEWRTIEPFPKYIGIYIPNEYYVYTLKNYNCKLI